MKQPSMSVSYAISAQTKTRRCFIRCTTKYLHCKISFSYKLEYTKRYSTCEIPPARVWPAFPGTLLHRNPRLQNTFLDLLCKQPRLRLTYQRPPTHLYASELHHDFCTVLQPPTGPAHQPGSGAGYVRRGSFFGFRRQFRTSRCRITGMRQGKRTTSCIPTYRICAAHLDILMLV